MIFGSLDLLLLASSDMLSAGLFLSTSILLT
jgi:hypothetical protein